MLFFPFDTTVCYYSDIYNLKKYMTPVHQHLYLYLSILTREFFISFALYSNLENIVSVHQSLWD